MNTQDFARVEVLFTEIAPLDAAARARTLDEACADRPDLREEIEALLDAHDRLGDDVEGSDPGHARVGVGSELGVFRLVERVGDGGMGEVYRGERIDGAYTQEVAIKVMRDALVDADLMRRFRVERQILASLRHANIVTLLDGGTTPGGQAYLAMEFVDGVEITAYCRTHNLSLERRLQLFRTLCGAVQYAHQHGVVHRDLKPANILVRADGVLKVLDFGVAKLLQGTSAAVEATRGVLPGPLTPNYASPEQMRGLPVTTASDVYALGILLYELVAGVRPYETQGLTLDRVLDLVMHTDPQRPSAVSDRRLRGDIDAIVLKAIGKEPTDRYDSAGELGSDVARYLARQPVIARVPSAGYVLRRLAVRHKTLVAVSALALLLVVVASGVALWQREVARREQARAEQRFREVRQLANALIFKIHDAVAPLAGSTPVRRTIVDEAVAYLERLEREAGADDLTLRLELAAAYGQIGGILGDPQSANLGDRDGAIRQYEKARAILLPLATQNAHVDVIKTLRRVSSALSTLYSVKNDPERALATAREAVDLVTRYQRQHPNDQIALELLAVATFHLAWTSPNAEQIPLWERTIGYFEQLLAAQPSSAVHLRNVALAEKYLANALGGDQSIPHFRRALGLDEQRLAASPDNREAQFDTAISLAGLADMLTRQGNLEESAPLLERSLELRRQLADTDPKNVQVRERLGYVLAQLADLHVKRGANAEARSRAREAVEILERVRDVTHDRSAHETLAFALLQMGYAERATGNRSASCAAFRRAHSLYSGSPSAYVEYRRDTAAKETAACR